MVATPTPDAEVTVPKVLEHVPRSLRSYPPGGASALAETKAHSSGGYIRLHTL
jgi:hypothetical protein